MRPTSNENISSDPAIRNGIRAATMPEAIDRAFADPAVHDAAEADLRRSIEQGRNRVPVTDAAGNTTLGFADAELHALDAQQAMAAEVRACAMPAKEAAA